MTKKDNLLLSLLRCADSATETTISNTLKAINSVDIEELDNWTIEDSGDGNVSFYLINDSYIGTIIIDDSDFYAFCFKKNVSDYNIRGKMKFSIQSFKSILQLINYLIK